jgi:hypothetical protein
MTRHSRRGFTLIEALIVMTSLGLTLSLGAIILIVSMRANQLGAATLLHVRLHADIGDTFRSDVAAATAAPEKLDNWTRGPSCLILQKSADHFVIYEWKNTDVIRTEKHGEHVSPSILSVGLPDMAITFEVGGGSRPLIMLRLTESVPPRTSRQYEFTAALGGDRR